MAVATFLSSGNVVNEALKVQLHLQSGVPVLKGKHGPPVEPEGGGEHLFVKDVLDGLVIQVLVRRQEELHDLQAAPLSEVEFSVCMGVLAPVDRGAAEGVIGVMLVEPVELIQYRGTGLFQRGDGAEQVPQALKMVLHLPAAPHDIAPGGVADAVAGAAGDIHGLQNVDMGAGHLPVPNQEAGCRQSRQAAAYDIGALFFHPCGFLRPGEGLVIAAGIVDALGIFFVPAQLRIAVDAGSGRAGCLSGVCHLLRGHDRRAGAGQARCRSGPFPQILIH